jgi:AcrR family transcriptional regulator
MVRKDAVHNRARILQAARALVSRDGAEVRMDAIAAEAGVAVGTLYRHFAVKEALIAAVVEDSIQSLASRAEQALVAVDAGAAPFAELEELVRDFAQSYARDRALKAAAATLGAEVQVDPYEGGTTAARAMAAVDEVLRRARDAGAARPDVTTDDLLVVLAQVPDERVTGAGSLASYLRTILRGIST